MLCACSTRIRSLASIPRCAAADRTGHAMLHTLMGQAVKHDCKFFIEYFATDLLMHDGMFAADSRHRCEG